MGDVQLEPVQPEPGLGTAQPGQGVSVIDQPSAISSRTTIIMSRVVWKMTALVSRVENLRIFSCSSGSLAAITPWLLNRRPSQARASSRC